MVFNIQDSLYRWWQLRILEQQRTFVGARFVGARFVGARSVYQSMYCQRLVKYVNERRISK